MSDADRTTLLHAAELLEEYAALLLMLNGPIDPSHWTRKRDDALVTAARLRN